MPLHDYQTENSDNSQKPMKSFVELLIKASIFLFVVVLFLFKDSIPTASNWTKYYYAASLISFFASAIIGLYNLLRSDRVQHDDRDVKSYYRHKYRFFYRLLNFKFGVTFQFVLFAYGFFATLIISLKGLCPLWPFC